MEKKHILNAAELRIGNLLFHPFYEDGTFTEVNWKTFKNFNNGVGDIYRPIPLTEPIILSFGFKKHSHINLLYFLDKFRYDAVHKKLRLLRPCNSEGESSKDACGFPFLTDTINMEFAHQLQNIYYSLMGRELEINYALLEKLATS